MLTLQLSPLPATIKGPQDKAYKGLMPPRMRYLAPDAATSLLLLLKEVNNNIVFTDILRSAEGSLLALQQHKAGLKTAKVQPPAYSPHNFGIALDLDIHASLVLLKTNYAAFTDLMHKYSWYCHRRDMDPTADESWHFNYLGTNAKKYLELAKVDNHHTWALPVEQMILEKYEKQFSLTNTEIQQALAILNFYKGPIDAKIGLESFTAITSFQRAWDLPLSGKADARTQRVLAFLTAKIAIINVCSPLV